MDILVGCLIGVLAGGLLLRMSFALRHRRERLGKWLFLLLSYFLIAGVAVACIIVNQYIIDETAWGKGHTLTVTWILFYFTACTVLGIQNLRNQQREKRE